MTGVLYVYFVNDGCTVLMTGVLYVYNVNDGWCTVLITGVVC